VFRYIDLSSVDQDTKSISDAREVACGEAPSRARQLVTAGDVLVSTVRPNLNGVARVPSELDGATASTGFCVLRPEPKKIDGSYLFQWVKSSAFIGDMVSKATGASYPVVSDRIIFESPIPLPPLEEQRRIAAILDKAETLRTQRRQALAHLDTLTQSLFLDMFGDPSINDKGWPLATLGDVVFSASDGPHVSPKYSDSGIPFLSARHVRPGVIDFHDLKHITVEDANIHWRKCRPQEGDLLYTKGGTTGYAAVVGALEPFAIWFILLYSSRNLKK
jgi:type I restriction enzyme S subunit